MSLKNYTYELIIIYLLMIFLVRYYTGSALLMLIHIIYTQSWAVPFPCSKTKSKMYACARQCEKEICDFVFEHWEGISLGWAQAVFMTRRYSGVYRWIRLNKLSLQKKFIDYIFGDIFYEHTISRML